MFYMSSEPCTEMQSLSKQKRYRGNVNFKYGGLHLNRIYSYLYMYIPSLFILLSNTFIIYSKISYPLAVVPKWQKALNDSLIIIPHIHTYRKKEKKKINHSP